MLAKRKMSVTELSERVGITMANLSILKNQSIKQIGPSLTFNLAKKNPSIHFSMEGCIKIFK
nr:helix-turn-helix domain-containing protein [Bacillus sp. ISL-4]